ncbi:MFS family permease [Lipingzhangella halophila]|uniref:MFS family permease n=1 Tax=Lipingzhangella halophila TaxID=1783352 RepID=A0A7W7RKS2_9ACTN|nr:MFS transporter [Lipingzhangella halophila]MBB4933804.1 MFS family permease [Lipingzhangella halophila]
MSAGRHLGLGGRAFRLLMLATVTSFCGYVLLLPLVPLWATRGGAGELGAGLTTATFMLTTVLIQLAMPWLLNHGGYRWTFPVGALLLGGPAPLMILTMDLTALIALSAVRGVGFGMVTVAGTALAARLVRPNQIGRAAGYYGLAGGLPNLVFLPTGVWLALNIGFEAAFWTAAVGPVIGAVAAFGIWLCAGDGRPEAASGAADERSAQGRRAATLPVPLLLMLIAAVASSAFTTFLAIPLEHASWVAVAALLAYSALMLAGRWTAGWLSDRDGRPVLLVSGMVSAAAGMALAAWAVWPAHAGWTGPGPAGAALVIAGAALFGAGFGATQNDTVVVLFRRAGPAGYGTASAAWNIGYDAGTGVGALGLGLALQYLGYGWGFSLTAAALVVCLPVATSLARTPLRRAR